MNKESKNALQQLTGKASIDEVPADELLKLAETYPYFSAVQLLLAQKMQRLQDAGLPQQLQKTALVFPNQQWLRYLLSNANDEKTETPVAQDIPFENKSNAENPVAEASVISEEPGTLVQELPEEKEPEESQGKTEDANLITFPSRLILQDISYTGDEADEPEEMPLDDDELQEQSEPFPNEDSNQKIASLLSEQAELFSKPVEEKVEVPITTEPFHTVDYFASQGIKLDGKREENTLDKKVHKFTDWLRQMKRINPHPVDLGTEAEEETFVASIADSSNYTKEILTESMAEVLLKQGKTDKALEIYQKLSLLNPDKSTYFAALIQKIK